MALNPEQRAELAEFIEDWKKGYDLSWRQLRDENERLQTTVGQIVWIEGAYNRVGMIVQPVYAPPAPG